MTSAKRLIIEIQAPPDGSGDGILPIPNDGPRWRAGDVLELDLVAEPGSAVIRNRYADCRQISRPDKS